MIKLSLDEQIEAKDMATENSKLIAIVLSKLLELQEQQVLKQSPREPASLVYEMSRLEGARKLAADFNRFLSEARKSSP